MSLDPAFGYLIVGGSALLFAVAGIHKLRSFELFTDVFAAYRVLPDAWARRLAWLIPGLELAIATTLPWTAARRGALPAAMALLIAYASGIAINLVRGRRELDCGCGAIGTRRSIAGWMVWRNLLLVLALALAALPWVSRPFDGWDVLTVAGGIAAFAVLYAAVDQLLGEVAPKAMRLRGRTA